METATEEVKDDKEVLEKQMKERLDDLPKKIFDKELEILKNSDQIEEITLKKKMIETSTARDIANIVGNDGKKVYSNEEKRKSAAAKALTDNVEYQGLTKKMSDMARQKKTDEIVVAYCKRQFQATRSMIDLIGGENGR